MDFKEMGSVYIPGHVHQVQNNLFYICLFIKQKCQNAYVACAELFFSSAHKTNLLVQILGLWTFLHLLLWLNGNLFYFVNKFCTDLIYLYNNYKKLPRLAKNNQKLVIQRVKTCLPEIETSQARIHI